MNKNLQDLLSTLGLNYLGKTYEKFLTQSGFTKEDLEYFKKYGPYLFWYYGLKEFVSSKKTDAGFKFNYLAMYFLKFAISEIQDMALQRKMIDFITNQTISGANYILIHIENIIPTETLKDLYKKILNTKTVLKTKELYIIAGANGTGKSTLAQRILANKNLSGENFIFINADEIARELNPEDVNKIKIKAGKETLKKSSEVIEKKLPCIIETTLSGKRKETKYSLLTIIEKAKKFGYKIKLFYIYLNNKTLCKERIKVRVLKGGHSVPDKDIERRYERSLSNFFFYRDLVDEWILYSNNSFDFAEIAKQTNKTIEITDKEVYNEIKAMVAHEKI